MTTSLIFVLLITLSYGSEEAKQKHDFFRDVHGFHLGHHEGIDLRGLAFADSAANEHGTTYGGFAHAVDLGSTINRHIIITKNIRVPIPQPYPITITKNICVPYPVHIPVPVGKPYPVRVSKLYPVSVEKLIPYTVQQKLPAHPQPYPVPVQQTHVIPNPKFGNIYKLTVSIGSGSLGYTYLGNGAYAIGSGGLGYSIVGSGVRPTKLW